MFFYKHCSSILAACFILACIQAAHASQKASGERIIPVKVVIDQYFVRNFNEVRRKEPSALPKPLTASPEDFAKDVIERLSRRYKQFGIRFLPVAVERIVAKERVSLDVDYMGLLKQHSCGGAELLVGLTGAAFISTSGGDDGFVVVVGSADRQVGRLFSQFASLGIVMNPKRDVESMIDTLDHEMRHIFGDTHKKEGMLNDAERKTYLEEGVLAIRKNRLQTFICAEPASSPKKQQDSAR